MTGWERTTMMTEEEGMEGMGVRQRRIKMIREGWKVEVRKEGSK